MSRVAADMRPRWGKSTRRELEFRVIAHHVKRDKEAFIERLAGRISRRSHKRTGCLCYRGALSEGYPTINFRYAGHHVKIKACRVFLILALGRPIRMGHDAGHEEWCRRRDCIRHVFEQPYQDNCADSSAARMENITHKRRTTSGYECEDSERRFRQRRAAGLQRRAGGLRQANEIIPPPGRTTGDQSRAMSSGESVKENV